MNIGHEILKNEFYVMFSSLLYKCKVLETSTKVKLMKKNVNIISERKRGLNNINIEYFVTTLKCTELYIFVL